MLKFIILIPLIIILLVGSLVILPITLRQLVNYLISCQRQQIFSTFRRHNISNDELELHFFGDCLWRRLEQENDEELHFVRDWLWRLETENLDLYDELKQFHELVYQPHYHSQLNYYLKSILIHLENSQFFEDEFGIFLSNWFWEIPHKHLLINRLTNLWSICENLNYEQLFFLSNWLCKLEKENLDLFNDLKQIYERFLHHKFLVFSYICNNYYYRGLDSYLLTIFILQDSQLINELYQTYTLNPEILTKL
ncbi:MAG: hypothetical protein EA365_15510 [Gloeocapsa sp. DLM2.Bin57]|nr:MAG: hypothetical protein EA365_15510 [Gloeocapsa sp. DLM2.Bin57]